MSNNSSEILAKTLSAWSRDFSEIIRQKTESLDQILGMFGIDLREDSSTTAKKAAGPENCSRQPVFADVCRAAAMLEKEKCGRAVRNLLQKYGVDDLKKLDPALYASFINDAEVMQNEPC